MSAFDRDRWKRIVDEARDYLVALGEVEEDDPVPREDVVETLRANGYGDTIDPVDIVEDAIGEELVEAGDGVCVGEEGQTTETPKTVGNEGGGVGSEDDDPRGETAGTGLKTDREAATAALRDVLRFYNQRVDDTIVDHTEDGEHPGRPTTAREYFTDVRGWGDETVDELLLGWAPPDHTDELVAYLHDRGHDREAMLATGALGETDAGGFYSTFSARYVLPYYDAEGRPAYAIARVTGGEGGGGRDYGGHPDDYKAGKYAKLRHTDERVPFDEPIYGLDTLEPGAHVVVAEGIADAITARELGYSVLSPVAKEFKEAHYDPLAEALETHGVDRVTIVADADGIRNDDTGGAEPGSVREAVDVTLSPVGAGLGGALRTATKLGDRAEADIRVVLPPAPADLENDLDEFVNGPWCGDLGALLRSARPPQAFDALEEVTRPERSAGFNDFDTEANPSAGGDNFDAEDYEPTATSAEETTDDIRDLYVALDRLDAQRVADRTIVSEWLEGPADRRTFAPTWAPAGYSGTANYVDRDKWVDTGDRGGYGGPAVMAAIDAGLVSDTECPRAVSGETWFKAVNHLRELGFAIPELEDDDGEEWRDDPRSVSATVDARRAWDAAGRVTPDEVDDDRLDATADGEAFATPSGERVDVVRAVAIAEGLVDGADAPLDETYPEAYALAREEYGAPLPEYYTTSDAVAEFDAVLDVISEATFWDLDADRLESEITAEDDDVGGEAVRALDPAWRDSESGRSVLVFPSGTIWDADTERVLDVVRFAALDAGIVRHPEDPLKGSDFTDAYRAAREEYGAPLPRWEPAVDGTREITAQLPPAEELVDARDLDGVDRDLLDEAREKVEALLREATGDADEPTVVRALPATGKTTGTVKTAGDRALAYLAPRKELQQQAIDKADRWGVDARLLPVFAEARVEDGVLSAAVSHVREAGKDRLRDRWAVLSHALNGVDGGIDADAVFVDEEDDADDVDLDRATCPTAEGEHGPAWALAVHVARALGYTPREIHTEAEGLFGAPLPCDGSDGCRYADGWDHANDPDDPADLLVGSYIHAHVTGVRTRFSRAPNGSVETAPRAVVLDEFPGIDPFSREFDDHADDHAAWLASSLREDVEDRRDTYDADLWGDEWVGAWLNGNGDEVEGVDEALGVLARTGDLLEAREAAAEVLEEVEEAVLDTLDLAGPLEAVATEEDAAEAFNALRAALDAVDPEQPGAALTNWVEPAVAEPLARATVSGKSTPDADAVGVDELPIAGDLAALVKDAIDAATTGGDGAEARLRAAVKALRGGREGCRRLAAWADDGYAHPDAHHLLTAVAAPSAKASDPGERIRTNSWAFDDEATDGTTLDVVESGDRATAALDRNGHGALLHTPPTRTAAGGEDVPVVGLDATARPKLWATAIGEDVRLRDVHETDAERARFLEEALNLRVIQAADRPRYYEGSPESKDTDGDVALLQRLAEEYAGIDAPRERGAEPTRVGRPAAITTKGVREVLESDDRLDDAVAAWDNYGNVKGSNDLGDHRLAAVLGCQHYGDDAVERFAALAGEEVDTDRRSGRGAGLDYGSDVANAYLSHMTEDQTTQAILRFARGDSGATVVARTSALRDDLPVVGEGQVVETWNETATAIAREYRRLGREFTTADVRDVVDVTPRQVRRVLAELAEAGYVRRVDEAEGRATTYERVDDPGAGDVELPSRDKAVASRTSPVTEYYTWNVRVRGGDAARTPVDRPGGVGVIGAPPAPDAAAGIDPPP
ncbi:MAG: hypothetical protein ACOCZD_00070 [Haloferacaceae archaeon]